ncbi:circumsporozoite protein [Sphingomonas sp. ASV193]
MKKVALTVAVLALGLAACESKTANAVNNTDVSNAMEADANAAAASVDNALDNTANAADNAANAMDNAAANTVNNANNKM